ncbi:hypothetical protein OUZ56_007986 [Daphnia magna]|uniref:Uncharacterized protein n=1 Tax=Daphnia magna TaxID=35525 RepID=A0ABR0ABM4_9CRUS|nr:hypothetical protein OUZ56_007986 [Daphnia magna]
MSKEVKTIVALTGHSTVQHQTPSFLHKKNQNNRPLRYCTAEQLQGGREEFGPVAGGGSFQGLLNLAQHASSWVGDQ